MKQTSVSNKKQRKCPSPSGTSRAVPTPTQQDYEQDRFYYNNDEDTREVLSDFGYNLGLDEEQRVSKYW